MAAATNTNEATGKERAKSRGRRPLAGLICCLLAAVICYCAENGTITRARNVDQARSVMQTVPADAIDPAHDGALVHVTGEVRAAQPLIDPDTGVSVAAVALVREVEMLQWTEEQSEPSDGDASPYAYRQVWSSDLIDASRFHTAEGHENPPEMPLASKRFAAQRLQLGQYVLPRAMATQLAAAEPVALEPDQITPTTGIVDEGYVYLERGPDAAQVGDVRIRYLVVPGQTVTVLAEQTGNSFRPYRTQSGALLEEIALGEHDAEALLARGLPTLGKRVWAARVVAPVLMVVGGILLLGAIAGLLKHIPFVRYVASGDLRTSIAVGIAAYLALFGCIWIGYRGIVGAVALAAAVIALFFLPVVGAVKARREKRAAKAAARAAAAEAKAAAEPEPTPEPESAEEPEATPEPEPEPEAMASESLREPVEEAPPADEPEPDETAAPDEEPKQPDPTDRPAD